MLSFLEPARFINILTVIGIIGHTQGVKIARSPPNIPAKKIPQRPFGALADASSNFEKSTGFHSGESNNEAESFLSVSETDKSAAPPSVYKNSHFCGGRQLSSSQAPYCNAPSI